MKTSSVLILLCACLHLYCSSAVAQEAEGELEELNQILEAAASPTPQPLETPQIVQTPSAAHTPQSETNLTPTPHPNDALEMISWELQLAQSGWEIAQSEQNRSRYLAALEKAVVAFCMQSLASSTEYQKPNESPECAARLDKLIELDDANPIGVCARDGIDSKTCKDTAARQTVLVYKPSTINFGVTATEGDRADLDLAFKLDVEKNQAGKSTYYSKLADVTKQLEMSKEPELTLKLKRQERSLFAGLLKQSCKATRVRLERKSMLQGGRLPTPASSFAQKQKLQKQETEKLMKELNKMIGGSEQLTPTPTIDPNKQLVRVRYLSEMCNSAIEYAKLRRPDYSGATCYYYGFYSPECTTARRKEVKLMLSVPSKPGAALPSIDTKQGLEQF